jgi:hypothetical protein
MSAPLTSTELPCQPTGSRQYIFEGIDLANGVDSVGRCFLKDDGEVLTVEPDRPDGELVR